MTTRALFCVALSVAASALSGAAGRESEKIVAEIGPDSVSAGYSIGPEDVLRISVWKNDSLSLVVPVRPDGMISLPLLNDVPAAGLTPMQLREALIEKLKEFMPDPEVSVIVQEIRSPKVSVIGQVAHPGRYEVRSRTTVLEALALAGGLKDFASPSRILVLRSEGAGTRRFRFDYKEAISDGKAHNFCLKAGDIIVVP